MARMKVVVIGGGMAGMSCAAELAQHCDVTVLEAEDAPGYHSSGVPRPRTSSRTSTERCSR